MKLTANQIVVLDELRRRCRANPFKHQNQSEHLFELAVQCFRLGDKACVYGMGALSWGMANTVGMPAGKVLRILKSLKAKGLVITEEDDGYQRPRYWWAVGIAEELSAKLGAGV
ncbi:hypothetical protein [Pseudomonas sp. S9]|uniref:hypothetical protein n=1 Tax=Pseudomonas sp. S9 TaxID=686578 RepID=UPI0002556DC2|nr:hypothetical protein [Pseudomonas sp. S9]